MNVLTRRDQWALDAGALQEIGRSLEAQQLASVSVRLPRSLVAAAIAAWQRNEEAGELGDEAPDEHRTRRRAASLALMGLEFAQQELPSDSEVVVTLQPQLIGEALRAASGED